MEVRFKEKSPPAHADYIAYGKVEIDEGSMAVVEVYWYPGDRVRIRLPKAAPASLEGAYLEGEGKDVNLKLTK
ncbi:MAG TPA: hypothetical protein VK471_03300 [Solirubrobacterales bacterium]|jgi:hypothetical protein|nr:hypothetical protein [Solirubrobacterales bacterium]